MAENTPDYKKKKKGYSILQPANKKGRHVNIVLMILRIFLIPVVWLLLPFKIYGQRKVKDGACIYVGNHYRIWDIVFPACTTTEGIHYLAKSELKKSPIWPICRAVKLIPLERNGEDVKGLMDALRCLKNNEKIAIYPEGTRNKTEEEMLPFRPGASMLAIKTRTPIIPVVLYKKHKFFHLNHVIIGEPFELSEYYGQKLTPELLQEADNKLRDHLLDIRHKHTEMLESRKRKK